MKIALDGRTIFSFARRGTGKNLLDLYRSLSVLRADWEFFVFHQVDVPVDPPLQSFLNCPNIHCSRVDIPGDRWDLWRKIRLPAAAAAVKADVLHCPANLAAGPSKMPQVVTIHDLISLDDRFTHDDKSRRLWHKKLLRAASVAAAVITPSEFSKKEIQQKLTCPADKIYVNHWAADSGCACVSDSEQLRRVRARYGLLTESSRDSRDDRSTPRKRSCDEKRFVLAFGGADPRKNTRRMIECWSLLDESLRQEVTLLIVGVQDVVLDEYRQLVADSSLNDCCLVEGFAAEADMAALISAAEILFYPSLSEGFGLPVLDGFACRTPVVCSSTTSVGEVAADAAELVDPDDAGDMANKIAHVLNDRQWQAELVTRGERRLAKFDWQSCASRAANAMEQAARKA